VAEERTLVLHDVHHKGTLAPMGYGWVWAASSSFIAFLICTGRVCLHLGGWAQGRASAYSRTGVSRHAVDFKGTLGEGRGDSSRVDSANTVHPPNCTLNHVQYAATCKLHSPKISI